MSNKYINTIITGGYTLGAAYTGVVVGPSGTVTGYSPTLLLGSGGAGITLPFAASLTNQGKITGGAAHSAGYFDGKFALPAGAGGAGVDAAAGSTVTDDSWIYGGLGGGGDDRYGGGAGGTAIQAGTGSTVTETNGFIAGGVGGAALATSTLGGGAGGMGIDLAAGLITLNIGWIYGGRGGVGGSTGGAGGAGGTAIYAGTGSTIDSEVRIVRGGVGGAALASSTLGGGAGGIGIDLAAGLITVDAGYIFGGAGGTGGVGGHGGAGGTGVSAGTGSTINFFGEVRGAAGGAGGNGGAGGDGVDLGSGLITVHQGAIYAGGGGAAQSASGDGGAGGTGLKVGTDSTVTVTYAFIRGGVGGAAEAVSASGAGGAGGVGVDLAAGQITIDGGRFYGGKGGAGGAAGGAGGSGVVLEAGGTFVDNALLIGGGNGGASIGTIGAGGVGGDGVEALAVSTIVVGGIIVAGHGGLGWAAARVAGAQGGTGVLLAAGGYLANNNLGKILGGYGGYNTDGYGGFGGAGVVLQSGGTVVNAGSISGGQGSPGNYNTSVGGDGVHLFSGGTVDNTGIITAGVQHLIGALGDVGINLNAGGTVVNGAPGDSAALISGEFGVYTHSSSSGATVINYGTISGLLRGDGEVGVDFHSASDRLVVESGSTIIDGAGGGGGTLELAGGAGAITGLGATGTLSGASAGVFNDFGAYVIDAGSSWTLTGADNLAAGKTLTNHGSLTNNGSFTVVGTLIDQGVLSNAAGASMTIANGGTLEAQGVVANVGTIAVASTGGTTDLRILPAGVTLTGGGEILLSGAKDRILGFSAGSTLTNVNNIIVGTCIFGAANLLTLINEAKGTIDATGGIMIVDTSGATVTNAGLMESTASGLLGISSTTINQSGGGTLNAAGGMINFTGADIIGGTIASTTGSAVRVLTGANMLDGTTSTVSLTGTLQVLAADTLTMIGTINNTGKLNLYGGTLMVGAGGAVLTGKGQVNLTASAANAITSTAAGATLTNAGNAIFGSGTIGGGTLSLVNQAAGVISNGLSVALTINTGSNTVINAGAIAATAAGGGVNVQSAVNNTGRLIANAGGTLTMNGAVTGAGIGQINGGELIIAQAFAENVVFLGTGTLELEDSVGYTGKVAGLSNTGTNSLDLRDITFTSGVTKATYSGATASGTLTVTDGTHTAHIQLVGNYTTAGAFVLSSDGHGGTTVVDPTPSAALTQAMASFQIGAAVNPAGPSPGAPFNLPLIAVHG